MACTQESGTCEACRSGCTHKPGWFVPGEAEKAAGFLGMPLDDFFRQYLAVDWWEADHRIGQDTFVLSPAIVGEDAGTEMPGDPLGTCVFYEEGRCRIHPVKPFECRETWCGSPAGFHQDAAQAWTGHQDQITALLGRGPVAAFYAGDGIFGLLNSIFGGEPDA